MYINIIVTTFAKSGTVNDIIIRNKSICTHISHLKFFVSICNCHEDNAVESLIIVIVTIYSGLSLGKLKEILWLYIEYAYGLKVYI